MNGARVLVRSNDEVGIVTDYNEMYCVVRFTNIDHTMRFLISQVVVLKQDKDGFWYQPYFVEIT